MTVPFDTLDYARKLEQAGVPAAQALEQTRVLAEALMRSKTLVGDLNSLEHVGHNLAAKIDEAALKLDGKLAVMAGAVNLQTWMLAILITINAAVAAKLFGQ